MLWKLNYPLSFEHFDSPLLHFYFFWSMTLALETESQWCGHPGGVLVTWLLSSPTIAHCKVHKKNLPMLILERKSWALCQLFVRQAQGQKVLKGRQENKCTLKWSLPTWGHLSHPVCPSHPQSQAGPCCSHSLWGARDLICFTSKPLPVPNVLWYRQKFSPGMPCFLSKCSFH